jgi:hypothetical protein
VACLLCGKTIVPLSTAWSDNQREQVVQTAQVHRVLSKESMYYYYWMCYEDALCRIDSGWLPERDIPHAARIFEFDENGQMSERICSAEDFFTYFCSPHFKNIIKHP